MPCLFDITNMWEFLSERLWPLVLTAVHVAAGASVTMHAVLRRRDTRAIIGWVALAWMAPLLGPFAYLLLGINRIQRKASKLRMRETWHGSAPIPPLEEDLRFREAIVKDHPTLVSLAQLVRQLTNWQGTPGNHVAPLINGEEAYPDMIEAIDSAERSVNLLSYIFDSDPVGDEFLEALCRAKDRGVQVRVLVDHVGSRYSRVNIIPRLKERGIRAAAFLRTRLPRFYYANLRNHRKILVVDGRIGFTGGTNIREAHCLLRTPRFPVQCLHFRLEGPVVRHLQETFAIDWSFTTGESLSGEAFFPAVDRAGDVWARGIADGPDEDFETISYAIMGGLAAASKRVVVVTPYFLPEAPIISALNVAAMRGIQVDILLPSHNNIPFVHWASRALWWQLLQRGCRVHLSPPPFDHTKLMLVDGAWSLIGSTNWDARSLRLNFEFNVECYAPSLAEALEAIVREKIDQSHEVTLEEVNSRTLPGQLRDGLARLLTPYL